MEWLPMSLMSMFIICNSTFRRSHIAVSCDTTAVRLEKIKFMIEENKKKEGKVEGENRETKGVQLLTQARNFCLALASWNTTWKGTQGRMETINIQGWQKYHTDNVKERGKKI